MKRILVAATIAIAAPFGCKDAPSTDSLPAEVRPDPASAASATPSASTGAVVAPAEPPTLELEPALPVALKGSSSVWGVSGHLLVASDHRIGRITGDEVEWLGEITAVFDVAGPNRVTWMGGTSPDSIDVFSLTTNNRAPMPTYWPLTGKGESAMFGGGGGYGYLSGVAYRDGSAVLFGDEHQGPRIITVRGPKLALEPTGRTKVGCPGEANNMGVFLPALFTLRVGSSRDGTIYAFGSHCDKDEPAVEIYVREGEPKIVRLGAHVTEITYKSRVLSTAKGVYFMSGEPKDPIVEIRGSEVKPLPKLSRTLRMFLGPEDVLHASDGAAIHRLQDGAWTVVARLTWPTRFDSLELHDGAYWGSVDGTVLRTRPAASLTAGEGCKTPFVHVFDAGPDVEPGYAFPTTRAALGKFAQAKEIELVEFTEGHRRVGVKVPSIAIGEALVEHIEKEMKDEAPRLVCYAPAKVVRKHPVTPP